MSCCNKPHIVHLLAKCNDSIQITNEKNPQLTYDPYLLGVKEGDYVKFYFCINCNTIQD